MKTLAEQIDSGKRLTYGQLVRHFVKLNRNKSGPLRTSHGRYNNFVSDYMAHHPGAALQDMLNAWRELKELDIPKTYRAWADHFANA